MKLRAIVLSVLMGLSFEAQADVLCIKKSAAVKRGKVALRNAVVITGATCPRGYNLLLDLATVVRNDSVTSATIVDGSVAASDIQDGTITGAKLASGTITADNIQDGSISASDLQSGAVSSSSIQDGSLGPEKFAAGVLANSISINPLAAHLSGGATIAIGAGAVSGIYFPDGVNAVMSFGFTVPQNYTAGTPITASILTNIGISSCSVRFLPNVLSVTRKDSTPLLGGSTSTGLTLANSGTVTYPSTGGTSKLLVATIVAPDGTQLQPGDAVIASIFRAGGDPSDTCAATVRIQGIEVQYQ